MSFCGGKSTQIAFRADEIDGRFRQMAPRLRNLGRPHVRRLALACGSQDRDEPKRGLDDALLAEERNERQHALGELRAVKQHAERPPDVTEDLHDIVCHRMVLGRKVGLRCDGRDTRHERSLGGLAVEYRSLHSGAAAPARQLSSL